MDHRVQRLGVAHAVAEARLGQQVGRPRHRLHAAADADLDVARADRLVEQHRRAQARGAHLVDGLAGDLLGMPALIWAWREGIWPWPACSTWPMITCCTWSGATSARSSAAVIAVAPSSVASTVDRPPPSLPMGVRAAPRITVLGIARKASDVASPADARHRHHRCPRRHRRRHDRRRPLRRARGIAHDLDGSPADRAGRRRRGAHEPSSISP